MQELPNFVLPRRGGDTAGSIFSLVSSVFVVAKATTAPISHSSAVYGQVADDRQAYIDDACEPNVLMFYRSRTLHRHSLQGTHKSNRKTRHAKPKVLFRVRGTNCEMGLIAHHIGSRWCDIRGPCFFKARADTSRPYMSASIPSAFAISCTVWFSQIFMKPVR